MTVARTPGRWAPWLRCLVAVLFAAAVGLWQTQAILDFRRPGVDESLGPGQVAVIEGVSYSMSRFTHAPDLPIAPSLRTTRWHGTTRGRGFRAHAVPTARTARGLPTSSATSL